ncbi:MAG: hypothetical protein ACREM3_26435 [Candidatus Rokuibacteriota bacterium]
MGIFKHLAPLLQALLLLALFAAKASAVTPQAKTFTELVRQADQIFTGAVTRQQSLQLPNGAIVTDVTIAVARHIKPVAATAPAVILRMLGGKVADLELVIDGAPRFHDGQRVLLFVRGNHIEMLPFVGIQQGVFTLSRDPTGVDRVFDVRGVPVIEIRDDRVTTGAGLGMSVADFLRAIHTAGP